MREIPFNSWADFKSRLFDSLDSDTPIIKRYLFRGQARSSWGLQSSFDRSFPAARFISRKVEYERYLNFFKIQNLRLGKDIAALSLVETASIAQHYGVPTRLLDWSSSPYVGAFFAFFYALTEGYMGNFDEVAVWVLDRTKFQELTTKDKYFGSDWELVTSKGTFNQRIQTQKGKFLECKTEESCFRDYCAARGHLENILTKLVIPARDTHLAVNDLILMGISPAEIYPDFEGVAKYVRLRMALNEFNLRV